MLLFWPFWFWLFPAWGGVITPLFVLFSVWFWGGVTFPPPLLLVLLLPLAGVLSGLVFGFCSFGLLLLFSLGLTSSGLVSCCLFPSFAPELLLSFVSGAFTCEFVW